MDPVLLGVFVAVYVGMMLGRVPGLRIDRTGIALLGAIVLLASGRIDTATAWAAIDAPTLGLLIALMVLSAQLRLGGFYTAITVRLARSAASPERLLGQLVAVVGLLSAVLVNDVICLAIAPVLIDVCARRGLDPVPFLLTLAAAANVGSAATLIGNPQNMLIGQSLGLDFFVHSSIALPPTIAGLALTWWLACRTWRGRFQRTISPPVIALRSFDGWQTGKGLALLLVLVVAFVTAPLPREILALTVAGLLLLSRRLHSREMLGLVDWQLCVLFAGLFIVHAAFARTSATHDALESLRDGGFDLESPAALFGASVVLSNLVSNVPAVMLLLPAATDPLAGPVLALASTFAGNLLLVGSIANLIVVEQAERFGVAPVSSGWFREHLRLGLPVTLGTLTIAARWLAAIAPRPE